MGRFADLLDRPSEVDYALRPNDKDDKRSTTKTTKGSFGRFGRFVVTRNSFLEALANLERRCPDHIPTDRWQQCVRNAERFLADWGQQAESLGWSEGDLFELHTPPENPKPNYSRLSRRDCTGLLWLLNDGERIAAMTEASATIITANGAIMAYHRRK